MVYCYNCGDEDERPKKGAVSDEAWRLYYEYRVKWLEINNEADSMRRHDRIRFLEWLLLRVAFTIIVITAILALA